MSNPLINKYRQASVNCNHTVNRNKALSIKETLQQLSDSCDETMKSDLYGSGEIIESFEHEIATMLGKEAALFLPSGTMAQPIALKIWADKARSPYVALHATSHLELHEENSYQTLYGLKGVKLGAAHLVPTLKDLESAATNPLAAILLELPMREIGGQLPLWEDLVTQSHWAKEQDIKLHLDGARLWQCPAAYDKTLSEICSLFDSVYVSFYKDLGGIAGAVLAGDEDFIAQAKIWQRRAGGKLISLYPYIIAAREGLKQHVPQLPERRGNAIWLAEKLNEISQITTWPIQPQTNMFRLTIQCNPDTFLAKATTWMDEYKIQLIPVPYQLNETSILCELTIGDAFNTQKKHQWQQWLLKFSEEVITKSGSGT